MRQPTKPALYVAAVGTFEGALLLCTYLGHIGTSASEPRSKSGLKNVLRAQAAALRTIPRRRQTSGKKSKRHVVVEALKTAQR